MTIRFLCPRGHKLAVPDNLAGKKGRCPICQQRVYIPVPELMDTAAAAISPADTGASSPPGRPELAATHETSADAHQQSLASPMYAAPPGASPFALPPDAGAVAPPPVAQAAGPYASPADGSLGPPPVPPVGHLGSDGAAAIASPDPAAPPFLTDVPPLPPLASPLDPVGPQELSVIIDEGE